MNNRKRLLEYGKKIISLDDLVALLKISVSDMGVQYESITSMVGDGLLEPVKKSGINGNKKYPLFKKYRIMVEDEIGADTVDKISRLHPSLLKSGYLSAHPKEYENNCDLIEKLSRYLFGRKAGVPVSRKERSFEIFGREKILDDSAFKALLRNLKIADEDLCFYDTPEYCFHDYIPVRKAHMVLLICENKDIWFNIRRCMFEEGFESLFGVSIDGVVYGNGNKVSQKQGALIEYVRFMGAPDVKFLYWGDIDREGFDIFRRTRDVNSPLDIELFIPGYRKMLEKARNTELEPSPSSKKEGMSFDDLTMDFTPEERELLNIVFTENKLIPQEIIPYTLLSER